MAPEYEGAFVQVFPDDPVGLRGGICQPARGPVFRGRSVSKLKGKGTDPPSGAAFLEKVDASPAFTRGGVPVLNRRGQAQGQQALRQGPAAWSPSGPESSTQSPTMVRPRR